MFAVVAANFAKALALVLVHEGGKSDDPHDPGGRTNWGITHTDYDAYRKSKGLALQDVYLMTPAERDEIYRTQYWDPIRGDDLPSGLDYVVFDGGVNSGISQSIKWLQRSIPALPANGRMGQSLITAASQVSDMATLIETCCEARRQFLESLSTFQYFGKGWISRVNDVQATALAWATGSTPQPAATPASTTSQPKALRESAAALPSTAPGDVATAASATGIIATLASHTSQPSTSSQPSSSAPAATTTGSSAPAAAQNQPPPAPASTPATAPPSLPPPPTNPNVATATPPATSAPPPSPSSTPAPTTPATSAPAAGASPTVVPAHAPPPSTGATASPTPQAPAASAPVTPPPATHVAATTPPAVPVPAAAPKPTVPMHPTAAPMTPSLLNPPVKTANPEIATAPKEQSQPQATPTVGIAPQVVQDVRNLTLGDHVFPVVLGLLGLIFVIGLFLSFAERRSRRQRTDALGDNPYPKTALKVGKVVIAAPAAPAMPPPPAGTQQSVPLVHSLSARVLSFLWIACTIVINVIALADLLQGFGFAHENWHQPFVSLSNIYDMYAQQAFNLTQASVAQEFGIKLPGWLLPLFVLYVSSASAFVVASSGIMKRNTTAEGLFAAVIHAGWVFAVPAFVIDAFRYRVVTTFARQNTVLFFAYIVAFVGAYIAARFINDDILPGFLAHYGTAASAAISDSMSAATAISNSLGGH